MSKPASIAAPATSPETLMLGAVTYARRCSMCHGADAASGGLAPDLRYSQPVTFDRYDQIVLGGALTERGMPSFKESLSEEDRWHILNYLRATFTAEPPSQ